MARIVALPYLRRDSTDPPAHREVISYYIRVGVVLSRQKL